MRMTITTLMLHHPTCSLNPFILNPNRSHHTHRPHTPISLHTHMHPIHNTHSLLHTTNITHSSLNHLAHTSPDPNCLTLNTPSTPNTLSTLNILIPGFLHSSTRISSTLTDLHLSRALTLHSLCLTRSSTRTTLHIQGLRGLTHDTLLHTTGGPDVDNLIPDTDLLQTRMMKREFGHNHFQTKATMLFYGTIQSLLEEHSHAIQMKFHIVHLASLYLQSDSLFWMGPHLFPCIQERGGALL